MSRAKFITRGKRLRYSVPMLVGAVGMAAIGTTAGLVGAGTASASSEPTFEIAYEGPLSGGNAALGLLQKYAVEVAIDQANAGTTFGTLPFRLRYNEADDQGSGTQSPTAAAALVNNPKVVAVVGPAFSGATLAAEPTFFSHHMATVSPSATNPTIATQGWSNFFRVVPDDSVQGPADGEYIAKALKVTKVFTVDDASAYGAGLAQAVDSTLTSDGVSVTHQTAPGTTQCSAGTGDVSEYPSLASTVVSSGAQLVFYAGYYCDLALFAKQLKAAGYTGKIMSDDGSTDPHYVIDAGASVADGTLLSCPCDISASGKAATFAKEFQKLAGFPIGTYSAEAYDATNTIIDVMKSIPSIASMSVTKIRPLIVAGLHKVSWVGLTKTIKFQKDGNVVGSAIDIYQVESGKIVLLGLVPDLVKAAS